MHGLTSEGRWFGYRGLGSRLNPSATVGEVYAHSVLSTGTGKLYAEPPREPGGDLLNYSATAATAVVELGDDLASELLGVKRHESRRGLHSFGVSVVDNIAR